MGFITHWADFSRTECNSNILRRVHAMCHIDEEGDRFEDKDTLPNTDRQIQRQSKRYTAEYRKTEPETKQQTILSAGFRNKSVCTVLLST